jgi:hypothetical protein
MVEFVFTPINSQIFIISQIAIVIVALFLTGLAVKAWKNTRINKMIYLIIAFGLFAITHAINYVDESVVNVMPDDARYAMFAVTEIAIMLMFVVAIIKK